MRMDSWLKAATISATALLILAGVASADQVDENEYPVGDRTTMWADPYLIGSLRHVGEIFASRPVRRGGVASILPRGEQMLALEYDVNGQSHRLEDYLERTRTTGLIVVKDGQIVLERYRLGADDRSLLMSMSVSKSFVSTLVAFAISDGLIKSVEDPITDYLPKLRGSGYEGVPIKAILQMSSGVDFFESYGTPTSDFNRMWNESVRDNKTPINQFVREVGRLREPYERFYYAAVETVALGWLVSRVTGKTLSDYMSEKLWGPLGMEADANWVTDGQGETASEVAFCCLSATLRDYARFGLLMAQDGMWRGKRLLPAGWIDSATRPDRPQVQPGRLSRGYGIGYQYHWWTLPDAFMAQGVNGQFLYVDPDEQLVIVITSAWREWWSGILENHTLALVDSIARNLRN